MSRPAPGGAGGQPRSLEFSILIAAGLFLRALARIVRPDSLTSSRCDARVALVVEARTALLTRDALTEALAARQRSEWASRWPRLAIYAVAWADSFPVREVDRFTRRRRTTREQVWVDASTRWDRRVWTRRAARCDQDLAAARRARSGSRIQRGGAVFGNMALASARRPTRARRSPRARAPNRRRAGGLRVERTIGALANVSADRGDLAEARDRHLRALALRERIGDTRGIAADHNNLGLLAQDVGDLDEARRRFEAALALNRRDGRDDVAATNLVNLAGLASLTGDFAAAEGMYRDALSAWREREMWAETADALRGLGQLEMRRGNYPAARSALREALKILDRTGPAADAIGVQTELATALAASGDLQEALDVLRRAQQRGDSTRAPPEVRAAIALARADLAVQLNAFAQADLWYTRAERLYRAAGDVSGEAEALHGRGALFLERDDYARGRACLKPRCAPAGRRESALRRLTVSR